jgi:hypothetical protein
MEHGGDATLEVVRAMFDTAGVQVLQATDGGNRTFMFDIGGMLSDEQEAQLTAACHAQRVKLDVNAPSSRYVIDGRSP